MAGAHRCPACRAATIPASPALITVHGMFSAGIQVIPRRACQRNGGHQVTTVIAVIAAITAAFCFAVAAMVQQSVARASGADEVMQPRLLLDLARRPRWLAGIG